MVPPTQIVAGLLGCEFVGSATTVTVAVLLVKVPHPDPVCVIIFLAVIYHVGFFVFSWIIHATTLKFFEWIKSNIEIAKRNEKVTPNWKQ